MIVTQGSRSAIVNWESFDIGQDAFVNVVQPNVDASMPVLKELILLRSTVV